MPKSKKLHQQIEKKLDQLQELLDNIQEVQNIDPNDSETWDPDTLYGLVENLKETLQLLEDQKGKQLDDFGEPIILEEGLCSLVDSYQEKKDD